ncbi:MAG: adenine deaminase [Saprospiraceae bacterium]|nr:adenine deaminase [Saprospiraceae bacterium]
MSGYTISGQIIDIINKVISKGIIVVENGKISKISPSDTVDDQYILPGFIDAHIHIESSMVTPYEFARTALGHGTIATVSDPHEIANVCGLEGVQYMIENAKDAKLKFHFGAPSCVPATAFENAGATIGPSDIEELMQSSDIWYLSEMMNYPGVLANDPEILAKIASAHKYGKPVDGHAPGLRGDDARKYIEHGISTDHECVSLEEALDKLKYGMKIIIREGSAAKNFDALHPLIATHPEMVMFCSDDKHPDDLLIGHINLLVARSLALGYDLFDVLKIACLNPVNHYKLPVGTLNIGDAADFIVVQDLQSWPIKQTVINGEIVFENDTPNKIHSKPQPIINQFNTLEVSPEALKVSDDGELTPVICAIDGSLITEKLMTFLPVSDRNKMIDSDHDILKIVVINRYQPSKPAIGFIKNFGLKSCAIASTVAHDSHNIIAVGDDDDLLAKAINQLVKSKGGLSAVSNTESKHIALPIAGLMSDLSVVEIGNAYTEISSFVKYRGCTLHAPFMTLSFMALLVIPKIKISDLGMFDAEEFHFY